MSAIWSGERPFNRRSPVRYWVRVDRDDASRTYLGPYQGPSDTLRRDAAAWRDNFPSYEVAIVSGPDVDRDVREWERVTNHPRGGPRYFPPVDVAARLEYLRGEIRAERISWGELYELQTLAAYIDRSDVELLEAAGVPESEVN